MKIALYARISTEGKGQELETQLQSLRQYAAQRGWEVIGEYTDSGYSGAKARRPGLDMLFKDLTPFHEGGQIKAILIWSLDRLGRNLKHLITMITELHERDVSLISYHEQLDFTTTTGKLLFHVIGALAEFERELIRERVKAGIRRVKLEKGYFGRPTVYTPWMIEKIATLRHAGLSYRKIVKEIYHLYKIDISVAGVHKTMVAYLGPKSGEMPHIPKPPL